MKTRSELGFLGALLFNYFSMGLIPER